MKTIEKVSHPGRAQIFTLSHVLSPEECADFIRRAESEGFSDAPINAGFNRFRMAPEIRNNQRVMQDDRELAAWLWQRVEPWVPATVNAWRAIGLNERFRYYRYTPGQYFEWHFDGAFHRSPRESSLFTVLLYLNEDFEGGTTDFMDEDLRIAPRAGMVLAFEHPVCHRGAPVVRGTKYVLRTDVMYVDEARAAWRAPGRA